MYKHVRVMIVGILGGALFACTTDRTDPRGYADVVDVEALPDRPADGATVLDVPAMSDATTDDIPRDVRDDRDATCSPPCGVGQVCCTDEHGHFPACRAGSMCTDAGGP